MTSRSSTSLVVVVMLALLATAAPAAADDLSVDREWSALVRAEREASKTVQRGFATLDRTNGKRVRPLLRAIRRATDVQRRGREAIAAETPTTATVVRARKAALRYLNLSIPFERPALRFVRLIGAAERARAADRDVLADRLSLRAFRLLRKLAPRDRAALRSRNAARRLFRQARREREQAPPPAPAP